MSGLDALVSALRQTYSSNPADVHAAEQYFHTNRGMAGFATALLQVMSAPEAQVDQYTKQAAAIQFKNATHLFWDAQAGADGRPACMGDAEKATVRSNIIEAIIMSHPLIRKQLALTLKRIAMYDFPEKWPELVPKLISFLTAQNPASLTGGLVALRAIARNYEFTTERDGMPPPALRPPSLRPALVKLVDEVFPTLDQLVDHLSKTQPTVDTLNIERLLLKILWSCTNMGFTPYMSRPDVLPRWLGFIKGIVDRTVTTPVPADAAGGAEHPWWRAAKRAAEITIRWLIRYGSPNEVKKELKPVVKDFQTAVAPALGVQYLTLLANHAKGQYFHPKMLYSAMSYLSTGVRVATVYKEVAPHLQGAFTEVLFQMMCYTEEDEGLFINDPVEYIRREFDPLDNYYSLRLASMNLTVDCCKFRGKNHLVPFMSHVAQVLQLQSAASRDNARKKFGAMVAVTALDGKLKKTEPFKSQLEFMLRTCVVPELASPVPIVRAMASWCFARFSDITFSDSTVFASALQQIITLANDQQLAVSLYAALSLKYPVQTEQGKQTLLPILPHVLEIYFRLLDNVDVDADDLVVTLEVFTTVFGADIAPHAFNICKRLVESFVQGAYSEDDEEGQTLKSVGCLEAIETLLQTVSGIPQLFHELGVALIPVCVMVLSRNCDQTLDYLPSILNIMTLVTYFNPPLKPQYWTLFPILYQAFDEYALEFIDDMLEPLDNFISRGKETFLSTPVYMDLVYKMVEKYLADANSDEIDSCKACQLAEVVMHHCVGAADQFVLKVVQLAANRIKTARMTVFRVLLVEIFANALYYNPAVALQASEALGATQQLFASWFSLKESFARVYDKKIAVLGLSAMLRLPMGTLPAVVRSALPQIVKQILKHLREIQRQEKVEEKERKLMEEQEGDDDDDDEDDFDEEIDDEEVELGDDEDAAIDQAVDIEEEDDEWADANELGDDQDQADGKITFDGLVDKCATFRQNAPGDDVGFAELDEDEEVDTPVNDVSEVVYFVDTIQVAGRDPQYQAVFASLDQKDSALAAKFAQLAVTILDGERATDYPRQWPDLLARIRDLASRRTSLRGALAVLREVVKNYEYSSERDVLVKLVDDAFPALDQLVDDLRSAQPTDETLDTESLLLKIFLSCTRGIVDRTVATAAPADSEHLWWKTGKEALQASERWLSRHGEPSVTERSLRPVLRDFQTAVAPALGMQCLALLTNHARSQQYYHPLVLHGAFSYLSTGLRMPTVLKWLKPHLPRALVEVLLPLASFTEEEEAMFTQRPAEFIEREFDIESSCPTRQLATSLIADCCRFHRKALLAPFMAHIALELQLNSAASSDDARTKARALAVVTALDKLLKGTEPFKVHLEAMLRMCVVPEIMSPVPIVRAMASLCFAHFSDLAICDTSTTFISGVHHLIVLAQEQHLAVSFYAALSLRFPATTEQGRQVMLPNVGGILAVYSRLLECADLLTNPVVEALERIIEEFGTGVSPYALDTCKHLVSSFARCERCDDEGSLLRLQEILEAIEALLRAVGCHSLGLRALANVLTPFCCTILSKYERSNARVEFMAKVCNFVQWIAQQTPLEPQHWQLFVLLCRACEEDVHESFGHAAQPLVSFIRRDKQTFLSAPLYANCVLGLMEKVLSDTPEIDDCARACQLAEAIMQHCIGAVDRFASRVLELTVACLRSTSSSPYHALLVKEFASTLYYNPELALQTSELLGATQELFSAWFRLRNCFARVSEKKLAVLGLSAMLRLPMRSLPAAVQGAIGQILSQILTYLHEIPAREQKERRLNEMTEHDATPSGSDGGDQDSEEDMSDEDDAPEDSDAASEDPDESGNEASDDCSMPDEDEEDEGDEDYDDESELSDLTDLTGNHTESPLRGVNEVVYFVDTVEAARGDPQFQGVVAGLGQRDKARMTHMAERATAIRALKTEQ
eukprot:m51a1_g11287 hypothetical protein (1932) ;mRNA; r:32164-40083